MARQRTPLRNVSANTSEGLREGTEEADAVGREGGLQAGGIRDGYAEEDLH